MRQSQTSDRVSRKAGRWATVTAEQIKSMEPEVRVSFAADVRSMAASLLRQDEVKGLRGVVRRLFKGDE